MRRLPGAYSISSRKTSRQQWFTVQMDVINKISKVPGLPDAPVTNPREEFQVAHSFYVNGCVRSSVLSYPTFNLDFIDLESMNSSKK